jgi:hypothetical protein
MRVFAVSCVALVSALASGSAQTKPSPAVAVVRQLYADFACEAVIDEPGCDSRHELVDQPRAVLAKYFDDQLIRLWLADRLCAARTHEICNLDFSPIWNSQDPSGTFIRISPTSDSTKVDVELRHPFYKEPRLLHYTLVPTRAGWRIHDIASGKEWSLVTLLSKKQ